MKHLRIANDVLPGAGKFRIRDGVFRPYPRPLLRAAMHGRRVGRRGQKERNKIVRIGEKYGLMSPNKTAWRPVFKRGLRESHARNHPAIATGHSHD